MHINCIICSDLLTPTADVYVTKCGHLFHYVCLLNWIQRKPSCPQCRSVVTETKIFRIYFNLSSDDSIVEDVGTLINKVENLEFQQSLNKKEVLNYKEKVKKLKEVNLALRTEIGELERREKVHESAMHALKEQISYFKSKSKETDRLTEEIVKLKGIIKNTQNIQTALEGSREQVNDLILNENNVESLAILATTLKKSLLDAERRKRDMEFNLKRVQNEASKFKRQYNDLTSEHMNLKRELEHLKSNFKLERLHFKKKLNESIKDDVVVIDSSIECLGSENSICSPKRNTPPKCDTSVISVHNSTIDLTSSDSPYLSVKSNPLAAGYSSFLSTKYQTNPTSPKKGYPLYSFKPMDSSKSTKNKEVCYNGLGGSSKEDVYPSPKPSQTGIKRHKSATVTSNKLRKLAPLPEKGKVTDFFNK